MTTYLAVDHVLFNESDAAAVFTVRVIGDAPQSDISVLYNTQTASARGTVNYTGVSVDTPATVTIAAGQTQATISIPLLNDGVDALLKGFLLQLSLPAGTNAVLTNSQAVALISDSAGNAAIPTFRTHDAVVDETGDHALVQYTLDAPTDHDVTVDYTTRGLNALAGEDFAAISGTLTIAAGQTAGTISIPIYKDGVAEAREMFAVNFSNPVGVTIAEPVAHVTIEGQNGALSPLGLTGVRAIGNIAYEDEGYIDLFVALTAASATEVKVNYATGASTARYNVDYYHQTGTLVFAPGEVIKTVRVLLGNQPGDDGTVASREFTFSLSAYGAFHSVSNAKGVILNRDTPVPDTQVITPMSGETTGGLLYGTSNDDSIVGGSGNDQLDGHEGNDTMVGGAGDDTYVLEQAGDSAVEAADSGNDTLITYLGSTTLDANFENLVLASTTDLAATGTGNTANNLIVGNDGGNVLTGLIGNDTLEGGAGNDTLVGGQGDDVYGVDSLGDVVTELAGEGTQDTIRAWISYSLTSVSNIENLSLAGRADINATGDSEKNVLTGNVGANVLDGGAGDDTLYGGDGNDTLTGGIGNDTMAGGKGDDSYNVEAAGDVLIEAVGGGTDTVTTTVDYTLTIGAEIERAYLSGTATKLTGNELANALYGGSLADSLVGAAGNDTFDGGAGNDTLVGGLGDDVYILAAGDVVVEDSGAGNDEIRTQLSSYGLATLANVENLVFTGAVASTGTGNAQNNRLSGTAANDTLSGGDGNDTLDGGAGDDSLIGGAGDDLYVVDSLNDTLVEAAGAGTGTDTVQISLTHTLAANFENLILTGSAALNGTGNTVNNQLTGNSGANTLTGLDGNDTLDGGAGADSLVGGAGDDSYLVDNAADSVTEGAAGGTDSLYASANYTLAAGTEIERAYLSGTATALTGNELANALYGAANNDTLAGAAGNDAIDGGAGNDSLDGGLGDDTLLGNIGNDTLDGGVGSDSLAGGAGDDTYYVDAATDTVVEVAGEGSDTVIAAVNYTLATGQVVETLALSGTATSLTGNELANALAGGTLNDSLSGLAGNDSLSGAAGADTLLGGDGADTLNGGAGIDSLVGGLGDDLYQVDSTSDVIVEVAGEGADRLWASVNYTLGAGLSVETLSLVGAANALTGNELLNTLNGSALADTLDGGAGDDTLNGAAGTDSLIGGDGADSLLGGDGIDTLSGDAGDDFIDGGLAADSLEGGAGNDTYVVDDAGDLVIEALNAGIDTVRASISYNISGLANVEHVTLTGLTVAINATGNDAANILTGNAGANQLSGGLNADTLNGGDGADTVDGGSGIDSLLGGMGDDLYRVDNAGDVIVEVAGAGADRVWATANYTLAAGVSVESLTLLGAATALTGNELANTLNGGSLADSLSGGAGSDSVLGNAGADTLIGGDGNDTLNGGAAADSLVGGAGDDLYLVDSASDLVVEATGEGADRIWASANYTLAAGVAVETLSVQGSANALTGNELANILYGGSLNDSLTGLDGNDSLSGLAGTDRLDGGAGDDSLDGGAADDTLLGGSGNDTMMAGAGNDSMVGSLGDDLYYVDSASDVVVEATGEGADRIWASANYTLAAGVSVESLSVFGSANALTGNELANTLNGGGQADSLSGGAGSDSLLGNAGADTLIGGDGNDTLNGGAGVDSLVGGIGDDLFQVDSASDVVVEALGEGTDRLWATVNYTLASGVSIESLSLLGTATVLTGNEQNNTLNGGALADSLSGAAGNDSLLGNAGADTLAGGLGNDLLAGGAGSDLFVFDTAVNALTNVDTISDFAAGDRLSLDNDVYTALGTAGALSASAFHIGAGLTGPTAAGQTAGIYYNSSTGGLYYDADGFGGDAAVQIATLANKPALTAASFVVGE